MTQPLFTVLLISHQKPILVNQAIQSVLNQTCRDFELLIVDSGALAPALRIAYDDCPFIRIEETGETPQTHKEHHVVSWLLNEWIPRASGKFITLLCDDDLYLPSYLQCFSDAMEPGCHCLWTGIYRARCDEKGENTEWLGMYPPQDKPKLGMKTDYLQLCHSKEAFLHMAKFCGGMCWPDLPGIRCGHDILFMSGMANFFHFKTVRGFHAVNRRTPESVYCGSGTEPIPIFHDDAPLDSRANAQTTGCTPSES